MFPTLSSDFYATHVAKVMHMSQHMFDSERIKANEAFQDGSAFGSVLPTWDEPAPLMFGENFPLLDSVVQYTISQNLPALFAEVDGVPSPSLQQQLHSATLETVKLILRDWEESYKVDTSTSTCGGSLRPGVLLRLLTEIGDPDSLELSQIIQHGVNIGLHSSVRDTGLFPRLKKDDRRDAMYPKLLWSDNNYKSADDPLLEPFINSTLVKECEAGFIREVRQSDLQHCCKLGAIGKYSDGVLNGVRLIEDHRRSGLNSRLQSVESCALPKGADLITLLKAIELAGGPLSICQLDVAHAFRHIRLQPSDCPWLNTVLNDTRISAKDLQSLLGRLQPEVEPVTVVSDASTVALGGYVVLSISSPTIFYFRYNIANIPPLVASTILQANPVVSSKDIIALECLAAALALLIAKEKCLCYAACTRAWRPLILHSDNSGVVGMFKKSYARKSTCSPILQLVSKEVWQLSIPTGFYHIQGVDNTLADWLSRSAEGDVLLTERFERVSVEHWLQELSMVCEQTRVVFEFNHNLSAVDCLQLMLPSIERLCKSLALSIPDTVGTILDQEGLLTVSLLASVRENDVNYLAQKVPIVDRTFLVSIFVKARTLAQLECAQPSSVLPETLPSADCPSTHRRSGGSNISDRSGEALQRRIADISTALVPTASIMKCAVDEFILEGLEWSTRRQYGRVETMYLQMVLPGECGFPLQPDLLARFVYVLSKCGYAPSTMESYTRSLRAVNSRRGHVLSQSGVFLANAALRAAKKMYKGPSGRKAPAFTSAQLHSLAEYSGSLQHVKAAALVAIFGLLRSEEILGLSLDDIAFFNLVGPSAVPRVTVTLKRSKTDGGGSSNSCTVGKGTVLTIACVENSQYCQHKLCPVHSLLWYVSSFRPNNAVDETLASYGRWRSGPSGAVLNYLDDVTLCEVGNYAGRMMAVVDA
ncbi:hypothetical protein FOL47_007861, partial [Perkinsus chesapeaki]